MCCLSRMISSTSYSISFMRSKFLWALSMDGFQVSSGRATNFFVSIFKELAKTATGVFNSWDRWLITLSFALFKLVTSLYAFFSSLETLAFSTERATVPPIMLNRSTSVLSKTPSFLLMAHKTPIIRLLLLKGTSSIVRELYPSCSSTTE